MRTYAARSPIDQIPQPPDTVQTMLLAAATAQNMDWGSTLSQIVRFTAITTAGALSACNVNLVSSGAVSQTSGTTINTGTSGTNIPVAGTRTLQIPPGSTGWSAAGASSGYIIAEQWRK